MPLVLSNEDVEKVLDIRQCMEVLEQSFKDYSMGSRRTYTNRRK